MECGGWVEGEGEALVYVACTSGWTATSNLILNAYPVDDVNFEQTQYNLATTSASGCVKVDNGKWYQFNPGAVETESGNIGITLPGWEGGNE